MERLSLLLVLFIIYSCTPTSSVEESTFSSTDGVRKDADPGVAQILFQSPSAVEGRELDNIVSMKKYTSAGFYFITNGTSLTADCNIQITTPFLGEDIHSNCIRSLDREGNLFTSDNSIWAFSPDVDSFLYVNTFYLFKEALKKFFEAMQIAHNNNFVTTNLLNPQSIPTDPIANRSFWVTQNNFGSGQTKSLAIRAICEIDSNAYFDPTLFEVCFGYDSQYPALKMAQDPTVVYHELGHILVSIMMNTRNSQSTIKSTLGDFFYDEAGSINEGIADYFSYYFSNQTIMGRYAFGTTLINTRAITETVEPHIDFVKNGYTKLSYPQFVNYNPNLINLEDEDTTNDTIQDTNDEDIHNTGMITSHFLVDITRNLETTCSWSSEDAKKQVVSIIASTLSELGDLTARGNEAAEQIVLNGGEVEDNYYVNHSPEFSSEWLKVNKTITHRTFYQAFAKYFFYEVTLNKCTTFTKDLLEQNLDQYGLLLFSTYNDNLSSTNGEQEISDIASEIPNYQLSARAELTPVNLANRQNTILTSKEFIALPNEYDTIRSTASIFDSISGVRDIITSYTYNGDIADISTGIAGFEYNNSNAQISPGEIVGISLNLVNNSNTTIGGVEILANDWDHFKYVENDTSNELKPCQINNWPLITEGGIKDEDPESAEEGDCNYTTRQNGAIIDEEIPLDRVMPICLVQYTDSDRTTWMNQDEYRKKMGLRNYECLNNTDPKNSNNNYECMVRSLKVANKATYSKIEPNSTWTETLKGGSPAPPSINSSGAFFLEVNKNTTPGTTFLCRLRVRFSNCSDCYEDTDRLNDDLHDFEFSGQKGFKVVDFKFTVIQ